MVQRDNKEPEESNKKDFVQENENINPPDTTIKKEGVTSSFSASTGDPGKYSGEDISDVSGDPGNDEDKIAHR